MGRLAEGGVGNLRPAVDAATLASQLGRGSTASSGGLARQSGASFSDALDQAERRSGGSTGNVTLSGHASLRLRERGIVASSRMIEQVSKATDLLAAKRARESLVVVGQVGFVVHVPSRVVVTAMPLTDSEPQVFTNIDSAVWLTKE